MCTVNEEDGEICSMKEKETFIEIEGNCRKCLENEAEVVLRRKDPYCRNCFLAYVTHKFRASLGKSKLVRKGDKVLVGFSGSISSLALVHLIKAGIEEEAHKRLVFEPFIVYIDEGAAFGTDIEVRRSNIKEIKDVLKQFNIVCYFANLENVFNLEGGKLYYDEHIEFPITSDSQLSHLFKNIKSLTSKEELLIRLRHNLLLKIATDLGCCKILTGETLAITASKLLSNISLGRGAQLPYEIGFCDNREKNVKILRPMQEFGNTEINFYCKIFHLKSVDFQSFKLHERSTSSIQTLTRKFVDELQENFPSTISTVYRTGAKLAIENGAAEAAEKCPLCKAPLDTNVNESSSLNATIYSGLLSKCGPDVSCSSDETGVKKNGITVCCNGKVNGCECITSDKDSISKDEAVYTLCYGCRLIITDIASVDLLPNEVIKSITENYALKQMKDEIQDYLL